METLTGALKGTTPGTPALITAPPAGVANPNQKMHNATYPPIISNGLKKIKKIKKELGEIRLTQFYSMVCLSGTVLN